MTSIKKSGIIFAAEYLELDLQRLYKVQRRLDKLAEEFTAFTSARDPSSAGYAQLALERAWKGLMALPVYRVIGSLDGTRGVISLTREDPLGIDDMVTAGTERNTAMVQWLRKLREFTRDINLFRYRAEHFLEDYAGDLSRRNSDAYAAMYGRYRFEISQTWDWLEQELALAGDELSAEDVRAEEEQLAEQVQRDFFPSETRITVSYQTILRPAKGKRKAEYQIAERVFFNSLTDFLYVDLIKGLAAGHIPRRCQHCGRWFLLTTGHDIRYCERIAPGERKRTCRQIGAHVKEKKENQKPIREEYRRTANRLKTRKRRGTMTEDEWNKAMAVAQEIKAKALDGKLREEDWRRQFKLL